MRLRALERRIAALVPRLVRVPTFEQFQRMWSEMDKIDKALYEAQVECPGLVEHDKVMAEYWHAVTDYLHQMGLAQNHYDLDEIVEKLEKESHHY